MKTMFLLCLLCSAMTQATDQPNAHNYSISLEYGKIAFFDAEYKNNQYGIELTQARQNRWQLHNIYGLMFTQSDNSYLYYGLKKDWPLSRSWLLSTSLSAGLFDNNHRIDLGHSIEFRSKLELAYQWPKQHRLGLAVSHLSNSRMSSKNPGTETVNIVYTFPLSSK